MFTIRVNRNCVDVNNDSEHSFTQFRPGNKSFDFSEGRKKTFGPRERMCHSQ